MKFLSSIAVTLALLTTPVAAYESDAVNTIQHSWGSQRMDITLWGVACGDVDGNGSGDILLLEERSLWLGRIEGNELIKAAEYRWNGQIKGLRLYTLDLNGDGRDEAVVSAVADATPASLILEFDGKGFKPIQQNVPWHLRVMVKDGRKVLVGQKSSPDEFFIGKLYRLSLDDGGTIQRGERLALPRWAKAFNFGLLPRDGEDRVLISLKGYAPLKAYELRGRKWKRYWTSGKRFGGTLLRVSLKNRPPMQDLPEYEVPIDHEPLTWIWNGTTWIIAANYDLPLRNIIGRRTLIKGSRMIGFVEDAALGFDEHFATKRLPGFISDYCVGRGFDGTKKLFVALQTDPEMFRPGKQSSLLIYDLPSPVPKSVH